MPSPAYPLSHGPHPPQTWLNSSNPPYPSVHPNASTRKTIANSSITAHPSQPTSEPFTANLSTKLGSWYFQPPTKRIAIRHQTWTSPIRLDTNNRSPEETSSRKQSRTRRRSARTLVHVHRRRAARQVRGQMQARLARTSSSRAMRMEGAQAVQHLQVRPHKRAKRKRHDHHLLKICLQTEIRSEESTLSRTRLLSTKGIGWQQILARMPTRD